MRAGASLYTFVSTGARCFYSGTQGVCRYAVGHVYVNLCPSVLSVFIRFRGFNGVYVCGIILLLCSGW